ncbi:aromatic acid exporter family protein [Micromonospora sp. NPDC050397]|uniref:FUSC family protein n=1 Tax=Micromonospora sp. NPDC050397 TaxID=3364279 RepID=UPI00384CFE11
MTSAWYVSDRPPDGPEPRGRSLGERSAATLCRRLRDVRDISLVAVQTGSAAGLAWLFTHDLMGNPVPVFAPITAISTLAASMNGRIRRTFELLVGIAIGVAVGDVLVQVIGVGFVQIALVVALAILFTAILGGGVAVLTQAASTAVLLVAFQAQMTDPVIPRFMEALIGGGTGLVVGTLLIPTNPMRAVDRAARSVFEAVTGELLESAAAMADRDRERANLALDRLSRIRGYMTDLEDSLRTGRETVRYAPLRWRQRRAIMRYDRSLPYIDKAVHDSGTLVRRALSVVEQGERLPDGLPMAVRQLGDAFGLLREELRDGLKPEGAGELALLAVTAANEAYADGVDFSGSVIVAQVGTAATDILLAAGTASEDEVRHLIQNAATQPHPPEV